MTRRARLAAIFILFRLPSYSQFLPDLQAKTAAEYDAYLAVLDGPAVEKGLAFEAAYPGSTLRLPVCERMAKAYRARGDGAAAIGAASRGLTVAPDYVPLLVELGELLANDSTELGRAAEVAQRALDLLRAAKAPVRVAPEEWLEATGRLRARAHGALGMVRFKRDDAAGAIAEFEAALAEHKPGEPVLHYRLGRLYALAGRKAEAKQQLGLAAQAADKALRDLVMAALGTL